MSRHTTIYGTQVDLYTTAASLPAPANNTDVTVGVDIAATILSAAGSPATDHELVIQSSLASATLTDVRFLTMYKGVWQEVTDDFLQPILIASIPISTFPRPATLRGLGRVERFAIQATISAGTVTAWLRSVEERG